MKISLHARRLLLTLTALVATVASLADDRPNIILVMSDDMGFSDIGCYGGEIETPVLDRLANDGLRFSQFYNTGRCCPTRASLLSGLYAHQAGVGHMMGDYGLPQYQGDLNRECLTIAEALKPAGYRTYMSGKWHVTPYRGDDANRDNPDTSNWPKQRGFDHFFGTIHGAGSFFDPNGLVRENKFITPENDPQGIAPAGSAWYYTDAISDNMVRYVEDHARDHADAPFFGYVAYTAAHWPMHALPEDIAKYEGRYDDGYVPVRDGRIAKLKKLGLLPDHWTPAPLVGEWDQVKLKEWESACMEVYAAMVDNMDQGMGRIVDALEHTGQLDNTLILFFQDNGGCAEGFGRGKLVGPLERPAVPTLPPMDRDELQTEMIPKQSRDGYPLRRGDGVMPGPAETEVGYGRNWANVSNTPFREYKHWVHEGGIATPLIAHWPKGISGKGNWNHSPSHLIDLMATALDLGKASYPEDKIPVEGISLDPALKGGDLERGKPIFWEHEGNRAVRDGKWKLVAKGVNGPWELYDMEADRTESTTLVDKHPELAAKMAAQYEQWAEQRGVVPFGSWKKAKKAAGSSKKEFRFDQAATGKSIPSNQAPAVARKVFHVTAKVAGLPANGVLDSQGGTNHGWSLYLENGKVAFVSRTSGNVLVAQGDLPVGARNAELEARVLKERIVLRANGKRLAVAEGAPQLKEHPLDGLDIGHDAEGLVADYSKDNAFKGTLEEVTITLK